MEETDTDESNFKKGTAAAKTLYVAVITNKGKGGSMAKPKGKRRPWGHSVAERRRISPMPVVTCILRRKSKIGGWWKKLIGKNGERSWLFRGGKNR